MAIKWIKFRKILKKALCIRFFALLGCVICLINIASFGIGDNHKFSFSNYDVYFTSYYESQAFKDWLLETMCNVEKTYTEALIHNVKNDESSNYSRYDITDESGINYVSDTLFIEKNRPFEVVDGNMWYYVSFWPDGIHTNLKDSRDDEFFFDGTVFRVSTDVKEEIKNGVMIGYYSGGNVVVRSEKYNYLERTLKQMDWSKLDTIMNEKFDRAGYVYLFLGKSVNQQIENLYEKRFMKLMAFIVGFFGCLGLIIVLFVREKSRENQNIKQILLSAISSTKKFIKRNMIGSITGERWYEEGFQTVERKRNTVLVQTLGIILWHQIMTLTDLYNHGRLEKYAKAFYFIDVIFIFIAIAVVILYYLGTKKIAARYATVDDQILKISNGDYANLEMQAVAPFKREVESLTAIGKGYEKSLEERIRSERTKIELVTNVSHDLKTPLTSIISYIDLLNRMEDLPEEAKDYVAILERKSEKLRGIVSDVFDIAKTASGEIKIEKQVLSLNKLLTQTLVLLDDKIKTSGFDVKVKLTEKDVYVNTDGQRMYRVFQNLMENALKYSLKGSRIFIEQKIHEQEVSVTIKNTANYEMNFTAEDAIERFFCGDKSRNTEGSGLGLSIAQGFTVACGGEFHLEVDGDQFKVILTFQICDKMEEENVEHI